MADISATLEAKSDQLNATDIIGAEPIIKVRAVELKQGSEQQVWVYFDGDNNKPWKPAKGMRRILAAAWGRDSDAWIGKYAQLMFEPSVVYAGKEVGGIRIKALSDIPAAGLNCALTISQKKREAYHVPLLKIEVKPYPADKFEAGLPAMTQAMADGTMTLTQVVARCQKTGQLTPEQLKQLEAAAPVEVDHDDENEVF
jgi:hypothetical protein